MTHLGDQIVADVAAIFGATSVEASQMRVIIDAMRHAWLGGDRAALETVIANGRRLFEGLNIDVGLVDVLGRRLARNTGGLGRRSGECRRLHPARSHHRQAQPDQRPTIDRRLSPNRSAVILSHLPDNGQPKP